MAIDREKAKLLAKRGISAAQIQRRTGVTSQAAQKFVSNASAVSPNQSTPATGFDGVRQDGVTYQLNDAGDAIVGIVPPGSPGTPEYMAATGLGGVSTATKASYEDLKNIRQGLKIGDNNIISKQEATKISKNTGKSFDQVLAKSLGLGYQLSNNAVRKSNKAYDKSPTAAWTRALGDSAFGLESLGLKPDLLSSMRGVKPGKGRVYSGTYSVDGTLMPLVETKDKSRANPLGQLKPSTTPGSDLGAGGSDLGAGGSDLDTTPMTPEQMAEASKASENSISDPFFTSGAGVWRRNQRGRGKGMKSTRAASGNQRTMPKNNTLGY